MPELPNIDQLSFWLGFVAASLFWWLISRLRPLIPALRERIKRLIHYIRERNLSGANTYIRRETIRIAQRWHLASNLFPLDDLLVQPGLLAPPYIAFPDSQPKSEPLCEQIIPYLPDWPQIPSCFGYPRLTLAEALSKGRSIAVIGQPGSGKSVCLAHLASQIARRETATGMLMDYAPILVHVLDLDLAAEDERDLLTAFSRQLMRHAPVYMQPQVRRLIVERFNEGKALLLIDGLDELRADQLIAATKYLKRLKERYPETLIALAASPDFIDSLADLGIAPLALASWGHTQRKEFLDRWSDAWAESVEPSVHRQSSLQAVAITLINNWLATDRGFQTPLEWTLKVWGAFTGDLEGPTNIGAIESYLGRFVRGLVTRPILGKLAHEFIVKGQPALRYGDLDRLLTEQTGPRQPTILSQELGEEATERIRARKPGRRDIILSPGEQILEELINGGMLAEHADQMIRFTSPIFAGILTATQITLDELRQVIDDPNWCIHGQALHYLAARSNEAEWIDEFIYADNSPLARNLQTASRWLADAAPAANWRPQLFRSMAGLIQDETLAEGLRARIIAGFTCSNDPSLPRFFKQLFASPSPIIRRLSLIGAGAWADGSMLKDITNMLGDAAEPVRLAACMALGALQTDSATNTLAEVLMKGDENMRQAAAESLAALPGTGHDIIKEAVDIDDILTRRAGVFGLLQIRSPWATQALEKISIQDGQWVVRNAASQAIEALQEPDHHIPAPLPKPWDSGWLIAFAAKRGTGILPNVPANDIIHLVLTKGSLEEQQGALEYAKNIHDDQIILDVYNLFYSGESSISESALYTIWYWTVSGVLLPAPHKVM